MKRLTQHLLGLLLVVSILTVTFTTKAQTYAVNPFNFEYFQPKFGINLGAYFNHEEFLFDFGLGLEELGSDFSATANVSFRPSYKDTKVKQSDHLYYLYKQKSFFFSLDLEKRFYFLVINGNQKLGIYAMAKAGYYHSKYKGISEGLNDRFMISPGAGVSWQFNKNGRLSLGYLYFNQRSRVEPHTIQLRLSFFFNKNDE